MSGVNAGPLNPSSRVKQVSFAQLHQAQLLQLKEEMEDDEETNKNKPIKKKAKLKNKLRHKSNPANSRGGRSGP